MALLDEAAVSERLGRLPGWQQADGAIRKSYRFGSFAAAIDFVDRVAALAEASDHHPDIDIRYTDVTLALSTHSAGGLTRRDFDLAERIEAGERA
jgi:4a-hydroxytetrahydrobiopterin dehydratase